MVDEEKAAANNLAREEKKKALLHEMLIRYADAFRRFSCDDSRSVAERVHGAIDTVLERDRSKDRSTDAITCGKGCVHCCKGPVEVFPHEAARLVEGARAAGIALDVARLQRQAQYATGNWSAQSALDRACAFLGDDGACRVYSTRPNACRKLFVVTEPAFCNSDQYGPDHVGRWISWEAEILATAGLEVFGAALMPVALLRALQTDVKGSC